MLRCNTRADGVIKKCLSDKKAPLFPREGFGVSWWIARRLIYKSTTDIGSVVACPERSEG